MMIRTMMLRLPPSRGTFHHHVCELTLYNISHNGLEGYNDSERWPELF